MKRSLWFMVLTAQVSSGPISLKKAAVVGCIGASADRAERLY
jgi:hypothetical protein